MTKPRDQAALAKQYQKWKAADELAHQKWDKVDRELRKFIKLAKLGRKAKTIVPISETQAIEIQNQFKGTDKVFTPAFCRKWKLKEVALVESD